MSEQLITLTTDFGEGSPYVAQMKAAALSVNPRVSWIDITHSVEPQNVRHGALVLADVAFRFPADTIHLCVVDPGVGTARRIVYAKIGEQNFIAPNNGLLSLLARDQPVSQLIAIESSEYWQQPVSATFHGRDIIAPVAAHLTLGVAPRQLGTRLPRLKQLDWPAIDRRRDSIVGSILMVDHFGNLITDITRTMLPGRGAGEFQVALGDHVCHSLVETYGQAEPGVTVALFGSNDRLEIAITNGNAARTLGHGVGDRVIVRWACPNVAR